MDSLEATLKYDVDNIAEAYVILDRAIDLAFVHGQKEKEDHYKEVQKSIYQLEKKYNLTRDNIFDAMCDLDFAELKENEIMERADKLCSRGEPLQPL